MENLFHHNASVTLMFKRGFDILLSGLGLFVSLPLWG